MGLVSLSSVKPGMELAEDIFSHLGALLLKKERVLTEKNILLLEAWGITEADVKGVEEPTIKEQMLPDVLRQKIALLDKELDKKFSLFSEDDKIMAQIKKSVRKIKTEEIME